MTEHVIPALKKIGRAGRGSTIKDRTAERTCLNCPLLRSDTTRTPSGKPEVYYYCGATATPLSQSSWTEEIKEEAFRRRADKCEYFGKTDSDFDVDYNWTENSLAVIFPLSSTPDAEKPARLTHASPSCTRCRFFISRDLLGAKVELPPNFTGLCATRGIAISNASNQAGECFKYTPGDSFPIEGVYAIKMIPEYNGEWLGKKVGVSTGHLPNEFDPLTYPSELEITEQHTAMGIRSWVGIKDPKSSNKVFLPIYDRTQFSSEELEKIPATGDESMPESYIDHSGLVFKVAVAWIELDETPCLIGAAGNGKTELLRHIAWIMQLPFERVTITASSEIDDLAGKFLFEDGETVFHPGRVTSAWAKPNVLCLDEPNTGSNDVLQFLRPLIDNSKQLVVDQNKGELIVRNAACFLGMAMNPSYDYKNIGANPMADADNSRLLHLTVALPPDNIERKIITERLLVKDGFEIPEVLLNSVMAISKTLRQMSADNEVPFSWGIRVQIKVARLLKWFDFHDAYMIAMGNSVDEETKDRVIAVVKSNTPER